jgi:hypothetical protein
VASLNNLLVESVKGAFPTGDCGKISGAEVGDGSAHSSGRSGRVPQFNQCLSYNRLTIMPRHSPDEVDPASIEKVFRQLKSCSGVMIAADEHYLKVRTFGYYSP